ncbi:PepSY-associated TM helix domain-containing protein [Acinetobacter wuhouensis]|uniref:PepSY domain-containing protein n=1 Tax=Acinetobacter wuhouensis TaxID=1879050 RepID=A0A4Q7ADG3_9GAMM|nr:PepSY-associated TM helix domain-containing protein [Acinetobacter wuhouensis]RZG43798.1 PepSY domain-containing protein [Acinetobacter wuhouensis]RZG71102.1 PepSY domain-containing protein [Acinetobacter wuhouensis]
MKVRTDMIRLAKELHTWVGITSGIFLFICFFAGGLSMFQHDLSRWASPPSQNLAMIQPNQYNELVSKVQADYPETLKSFQLNLNSKEFHQAPIQWKAPEKKGQDDHDFDTHQNAMLATLNADGTLNVEQENLSKLGWLIEQLHETAGIPGMLGHHALGVYVMGIVAVLYFLAIMTGLIVLLPTLVKDYFAIRKGKNKKRFWLDAHNVVGITSLPFHILISVSVIVFAFHDLFYDAMGTLVSKNKPLFERPAAVKIVDPAPKLDVEKVLQRIGEQAQGYQISSISFNNLDKPAKASARASVYSPDQMLRGESFDVMMFTPYQTQAYNTNNLNTYSSAMDKVIRSMFSLHFGNYGGNITRWLYVILGIGGAFLFYSGNILWIESRVKRQKNPNLAPAQQRKDVRFIAALTVGSCIGCVGAIVGGMLLGKWSFVIQPNLNSMNQVLMYSYYTIFVFAVIYAFVRGAATALPHLLLMTAILLFLLPLTSIMALLIPNIGLWASHGSLWWIDLIAILFALAFLRFYQQAKTRQQHAELGSIWSNVKIER